MDYDELFELLALPDDPPAVGVEARLHGALDQSGDEFARLTPLAAAYVEGLAELAVGFKKSVVVEPEHQVGLDQAHALLRNPWFRHGAEIELAREAVERISGAMSRWLDLQPIVSAHPFPESAVEYAAEMTQAYLFGFDASCVAFCSSALEQLLAEELVGVGEYTRPQLRRDRPTANTLILKARRRGIIEESFEAAKTIATHRNKVLHKRLWASKSARGVALGCIERFARVLAEIERSHET